MAAIDLARINLRREGGPLNVIDLAGINFAGRRQPMAPFLSEFTFAPVPSDAVDGLAIIDKLLGKSLVWNQLVQNGDFSDGTTGWSTNKVVISATDGVLSVTATQAFGWCVKHIEVIPGHKYLYRSWAKLSAASTKTSVVLYDVDAAATLQNTRISSTTDFEMIASIFTPAGTDLLLELGRDTASSGWVTSYHKDVILIDLTLMFGSGYEPATVEEFEALYDLEYYANNAGQIISNKTEAIEVVGFNQWDEEWEVGSIDDTTGSNAETTTTFRSKNYIPVLSNTSYYIKRPDYSSESRIRIFEYDASKNYLGIVYNTNNQVITLDAHTRYLRFRTVTAGTTYNHDICINISSSRNGEYEPYHKTTVPLNIPTITGKLNGEGESVVVFPQGMRSAGSVYDEAFGNKGIVRLAEVDLGTLNWRYSYNAFNVSLSQLTGRNALLCSKYPTSTTVGVPNEGYISNTTSAGIKTLWIKDSTYTDAATFKAAMAGVKLIYELATPLEYVLDEPLPKKFRSYQGGTMKQLPENGSEPTTAPMVLAASWPVTD